MRSRVIFAVLVVLMTLLACMVYAGGGEEMEPIWADTGATEYYNRKVIVRAKWGSGPGEIRLEPLPESYEYEPRLAVSRRGEIYLADPNNRRINVYDQNGKFLRAIKIPKEFLTYIGEDTIAIVEGMGVDSKGFVYIASSSAYHSLLKKSLTTYGEVVLKIDQTGAVVDQYVFEGGYVYPVRIQEDINGKVYLVGSWSPYFIDVPVPLNLGAGKVFSVSGDYLRSLVNREYKFDTSEDGTTVRIGEYNSQRCFIFQDAEGRIKKAVPFRRWRCRYYKHSWRFPYKDTEYGVLLTVSGVFDKNLNYYEVAGTPSHLLVIKYVLEEVWK